MKEIEARKSSHRDNKFIRNNNAILGGLAVLCIILSITTEVFLTKSNLMTLLRQITTNVFLTLGVMMCITIGGIDISGVQYMRYPNSNSVCYFTWGPYTDFMSNRIACRDIMWFYKRFCYCIC